MKRYKALGSRVEFLGWGLYFPPFIQDKATTIIFLSFFFFNSSFVKIEKIMALRMWASSTANALRISTTNNIIAPSFSISRCFSTGNSLLSFAQFFIFKIGGISINWVIEIPNLRFSSSPLLITPYICCVHSNWWVEVCIFTWMGEAWGFSGHSWHHWSCSGEFSAYKTFSI